MKYENGIYLASLDERVLADVPPTDDDLDELAAELDEKMMLDFRTGRWLVDEVRRLRKSIVPGASE